MVPRRVKIITDSSCDLPDAVIEQWDIGIVPLGISFGGRGYLDRVEVSIDDVTAKLHGEQRITVSLPSTACFMREFGMAAQTGRPVVAIHVSEKLSGTCQAARLAAKVAGVDDVTVVDSRLGTMGVGWLVLAAARAAMKGARTEEVLQVIEQVRDKMCLLFALHDLEYLGRIGRIGSAQAWLATRLQARPILTCEDGLISPVARVRGDGRVMSRLLEVCAERIVPGARVRAAVLHTMCWERGQELLRRVHKQYDVIEEYLLHMGPVVTVGIGPDAVGVAMYEE